MCRIISYNIANLNSKLNFGTFFSYILKFDVFFLFETNITADKRNGFVHYFNDYVLYWVDAKKHIVLVEQVETAYMALKIIYKNITLLLLNALQIMLY